MNAINEKALKPISKLLFRISAFLVGLMCIPISCDVVLRYAADKAIPGIIEIEEFLMVCIVFCAIPYLQARKEHIDIDILTKRLPNVAQVAVSNFGYLVLAILSGLMSWQLAGNAINKTNEVSFALGIPVSIFIAIAAIGSALVTLVFMADYGHSTSELLRHGRGPLVIVCFLAVVLVIFFPLILHRFPWDFSPFTLGILGMLFLFVILFLKVPIGFAMALTGFLGMWALTGQSLGPLRMLGSAPYVETASFVMAAVPLFVLMGELALYSGMSQDLFASAYTWFGRLPGGLAMASVAGCAGFAAVCGDSLATAVTMGSVALPEMRKKRYDLGLATGAIAAGGTLGILIPPSLGFIFYALITEESIGKLFIAGILPGVLMAALFILCIYVVAKLRPGMAPAGEPTSFGDKIRSVRGILPMMGLFLLILGGMLLGLFSPTEGGAIGAVGAFLYALVRRRMNRQVLLKALEETAVISCKLLVVVIGVGILGTFLASTRLPFLLAELVTGIQLSRYFIYAAILVLYVLLGCVMNVIAIILLTLPAIMPTVLALGFDPVWFGVVTVILMEMGQITPPIGIVVFAVSSVTSVPMETVFRGIVPFTVCMLICILLLTFFPEIALFLPRLLLG